MHPLDSGSSFQPLYASKRSRDLPEAPRWLAHQASHRKPRRFAGLRSLFTTPERVHPDTSTPPTGAPGWEAWADVLVDFRLPQHRDNPLPSPDEAKEVLSWPTTTRGWRLEGWTAQSVGPSNVVKNGPSPVTHDGDTVARFTDPDGFRFAFAVTQEAKVSFANGRLSYLLPTARFVFLASKDTSRHSSRTKHLDGAVLTPQEAEADRSGLPLRTTFPDHIPLSQRYDLAALRDAVADPDAWFATTGPSGSWQDLDLGPQAGGLSPARVLLGWAAAGVRSYASIEQWARVRMDPAELRAWQWLRTDPSGGDLDWSDDHIAAWFAAVGGGKERRALAMRFRREGLAPEQAQRWAGYVSDVYGEELAEVVTGFDQAGWLPQEAVAVREALGHHWAIQDKASAQDKMGQGALYFPRRAVLRLHDVLPWTTMPPVRAVAYLRAGVEVEEASAFEVSGDAPDEATLAMMAALRG